MGARYATAMERPREGGFRPGRRTRIIDERRNVVPMLELGDLPAGTGSELRNVVARANQHRVLIQFRQAAFSCIAALLVLALWHMARGRSTLGLKDVVGQVIFVGFAAGVGILVGAASAETHAR